MDASGILYLLEKHVAPTVQKERKFGDARQIRIEAAKLHLGKKRGRARLPKYVVETVKMVYAETQSQRKAGAVFGLGPSSVGRLLNRRGLSFKRPITRPRRIHNGVTYIFDGIRYWYRAGRGGKGVLLHRVIWQERHGPIPPTHYLMFRTKDVNDFSDANLTLVEKHTCLSALRKRRWDKHKAA